MFEFDVVLVEWYVYKLEELSGWVEVLDYYDYVKWNYDVFSKLFR